MFEFILGLFVGLGAGSLYGRLALPDKSLFTAVGWELALSDVVVIAIGAYLGFFAHNKHESLGYGIIAGAVVNMALQAYGK